MTACRLSLLIPTIVVLSAAAPAAAQNTQWTKHVYEDDGFRVEFSGEVKATPPQASPETLQRIVRATQYMQDSGDTVYAVGANLNKQGLAFDKVSRASFGTFRCKSTISETPAGVIAGQGRARELRGTDCLDGDYRVEARYFSKGLWFYQVLALFKKDGGDEEAARYFLQSFELIEASAEPAGTPSGGSQ
jgi:hypothetical protein